LKNFSEKNIHKREKNVDNINDKVVARGTISSIKMLMKAMFKDEKSFDIVMIDYINCS
jgi:hypothetical protein